MPKFYYFDKSKKKWVAKMNGQVIGKFKTEEGAKACVNEHLAKTSPYAPYTLNKALEFMDAKGGTSQAKTCATYRASLITAVAVVADGGKSSRANMGSTKKMLESVGEQDIRPLLNNYEEVSRIINGPTMVSKKGAPYNANSLRGVYHALMFITNPPADGCNLNQLELDVSAKEHYAEKAQELDGLVKTEWDKSQFQNKHDIQGMTYEELVRKLDSQVAKVIMGLDHTASREFLRFMTLVSMLIYNRPRRRRDYCYLQLYTDMPDNLKGKNILLVPRDGGRMKLILDDFKNRRKVVNNEPREILPRFEKLLDPRCEVLMRLYLKEFDIIEMASRATGDTTSLLWDSPHCCRILGLSRFR